MLRASLLAACAAAASAHAVVPVVDILKYAGRWYQVYADLATSVFESKYCVTTDYGLFANNTISVRNRQRDGSVQGAYNGILGWAAFNNRTSLGTADGSLSVYLQLPAPAPQGIPAPYDIILLGPATYGPFGLYQYAVVSDPLEVSLFVLTRDVDVYYAQYNATVMAQLREDGFINPVNEPRQTVQQGCTPYSETDLWTCVTGGGGSCPRLCRTAFALSPHTHTIPRALHAPHLALQVRPARPHVKGYPAQGPL